MKKYSKMIMALLVIFAIGFASVTNVEAKSRSGGSRSRVRTSRPAKPPVRVTRPVVKPKPVVKKAAVPVVKKEATKAVTPATAEKKNWGKKKDAPVAAKTIDKKKADWGTKKPASTSRSTKKVARTATQQKSFETAKKNGTSFKSKDAAMKSFKTQNATKYKSTYSTKPATRPSHIPQTTSIGGQTHSVVYRDGGYRYQNRSGAWMAYDAMADVAIMSMLMRSNNYYYDPIVVASPVAVRPAPVVVRPAPVVVRQGGPSGATVMLFFVVIVALCGAWYYFANKYKEASKGSKKPVVDNKDPVVDNSKPVADNKENKDNS